MSADVLRADNITAGYGEREVLRGVSFTIGEGDVLAVIGPNGSGKTTLLKAMLGMLPVKGGRFEFFGRPRLSSDEAERRIAYIPQRMELDRGFPITLREMLSLSAPRANIEKYLDLLDLRPLLNQRVGELSGGQMQRALLAYAIIKEPGLLVMDEPTSWVDTRGADCIICIIDEFRRKGIAIVVVSHDFHSLQPVSTHVLGLGGEGHHFFMPVGAEGLDASVAGLFGSTHHVGGRCILHVAGCNQKGGGCNCGH